MALNMKQAAHLLSRSTPVRGRSATVIAPRAALHSSPCDTAPQAAPAIPHLDLTRREVLGALASTMALATQAKPALAAQAAAVGTYLPPSGVEDFVLFVPDKTKTPALRAATVDPNSPYSFAIPPTWAEARVNNTQSGNYCQPRCDEPWTEVIFSNDAEGRLELIVSPLKKLTPRKSVKMEDLGTPGEVLERIGNFITGTYLDEEDIVSTSSKAIDGQTYYFYEINASYGKVGPHTLTSVTTKGEVAFLFIVSATDKQWAKNEARLRKLVQTFKA